MVQDGTKESIEDLETRVNLCLVFSLNEAKKKIKKLLPDFFLVNLTHSSLNLNSQISHLMHISLISGINTLKSLKDRLLHSGLRLRGDSFPETVLRSR